VIAAGPEAIACVDDADLAEMLGNLTENAARFARSRITIDANMTSSSIAISVEDDGPGIPEQAKMKVTARGERLDLGGDGAGLGLAIVADIVEAYGGTLKLDDRSPGLRAVITLPAADSRRGIGSGQTQSAAR
jgi:signal transduction histidine kinase